MSSRFETGNAQIIGNRVVQSNYFVTDLREEGGLAVLADGTIDSVNGLRAAVIACEIVKANFFGESSQEELFRLCQKTISSKIYLGRTPRVSLLSVWIDSHKISFKQVGYLKLYYFSHGNLVPILENEGTVEIGERNSVILCSRGVFDTLSEVELSRALETNQHPYEKAQKIIENLQKKNKMSQENATVVILEN